MPPSAPPAPDDKFRRILDAAYAVCEQRGVEAARMEDVAARARVSKGALYRHFDSKQALFLASLIDSYEESLRILDAQGGGGDAPLARLEHVLGGLTKVLAAMASRMSVHYQAWGLVAGDPEARARLYGFLLDFFQQRTDHTREAIREAQSRGAFAADVDAAAVTDGILALLSGFLYRATFDPESADPDRLDACFDALLRRPFYVSGEAAGIDDE